MFRKPTNDKLPTAFLAMFKPNDPWTLFVENRADVKVTTVQSRPDAQRLVTNAVEKRRRMTVLVGETAEPMFRPMTEEEIVGTSYLLISVKQPQESLDALLAGLPKPTGLINTGKAIAVLYKLTGRVPLPTARQIGSEIADRIGGTLAWRLPVPGTVCNGQSVRVIEFHGRREYKPVELVRQQEAAPVADAFQRASTMKAEAIRFLWEDVIPEDSLTIIMGMAKMGKSTVGLDVAARLTTGQAWPDGKPGPRPAGVVIIEAEDPIPVTHARLAAAGADLDRAVISNEPMDLSQPQGIAALEKLRVELGVKLVLLSPVRMFFGASETTRQIEMRNRLEPLMIWAKENRVAIIGIAHLMAGAKGISAEDMAGPKAIPQRARAMLTVKIDETDPLVKTNSRQARRIFTSAGGNYGGDDLQIPYRVQTAYVREIKSSRIEWLPSIKSDGGEDEHQAQPSEPPATSLANVVNVDFAAARPGGARLNKTQRWLSDLLEDGPMAAEDILARGRADGYAERSIYRAATDLRVKRTGKSGGPRTWELPKG